MYYSPDPNTIARIDLNAYKNNLLSIRNFTGKAVKLMPMIKANAYGHGMIECARTALDAGASMLGVCYASEGIELRRAGITAQVLAVGAESDANLSAMVDYDIIISVNSHQMLETLAAIINKKQRGARIHIKTDTGMGRTGIWHTDAVGLAQAAFNTPDIEVEGIFSHFPVADEDRDEESHEQIDRFQNILATLESKGIRPETAHICNSAGTLKFPEAHLDMVRPGIMTYGLQAYPGSGKTLALDPVFSLDSTITFIKDVPAGFAVSYGGAFVTKRPSKLATVAVGYGHGFKRFLSNRGRGIVNGEFVPVAGRICMDQTVFDITDAGEIRVGDTITLLGSNNGERIRVEEHAEIGNTITHEIVTGITGRVSRKYIPAT